MIGIVGDGRVKELFLEKLAADDGLTRDENKETHFCVYFAAYDIAAKKVFMGHHKKSGKWLFNGGHIDESELAIQALAREMEEEWGFRLPAPLVPGLLTITEINNPEKQACKRHYDIWYLIETVIDGFNPNPELLKNEFIQYGWYSVTEARKLTDDHATHEALDMFDSMFSG